MLLSGALSPWWLCRATSDRLLRPNVPRYLRGAPSNIAGPVVLRRGCADAPSQGCQAIVPYWPCGVSLPRCPFTKDSSTVSPQRCFQDYIASDTQGYQEAPTNATFTLVKHSPTALVFFELILIPGSAAQLLNQPVSNPGRLSLAGSTYFVMLLLYLTYYNLYQIALCLLKWTIRIQL